MQKPPIQLRTAGNFEAVFAWALLRSEREKCLYVALLAGVGFCLAAAVFFLSGAYFESIGDHRGARYWILAVPIGLILYELACARLLERSLRNGTRRPERLGLLNAFLEPTAVSLWLLLEGLFFDPGMMLDSPVAFAYPGIVMLSSLRLSWRVCLLTGLVAAVEYMGLVAWHWPVLHTAFQERAFSYLPVHGVRAALILLTGIGAGFVAYQIRKSVEETLHSAQERDFVVRVFGRYLSDAVVDDILRSPEGLRLGGRRRTVTLMMTDLRGFSTLSERLRPEAVIAMLNNYLSAMTEVIVRHRGTIDEFIGDAILAIFGAPLEAEDDMERGVACALEMQLAMESVNRWNAQNGFPDLEMGIGIHTGQVVVGNIGSETRSKYGVVGSAVNLTSRIESHSAGGQVLASAATADALGARLRVSRRWTVQPKGFAEPIEICDVTGLDALPGQAGRQ